jgi:hypothetical protein
MPRETSRSWRRALITDVQLWIPVLALALGIVVLSWVG